MKVANRFRIISDRGLVGDRRSVNKEGDIAREKQDWKDDPIMLVVDCNHPVYFIGACDEKADDETVNKIIKMMPDHCNLKILEVGDAFAFGPFKTEFKAMVVSLSCFGDVIDTDEYDAKVKEEEKKFYIDGDVELPEHCFTAISENGIEYNIGDKLEFVRERNRGSYERFRMFAEDDECHIVGIPTERLPNTLYMSNWMHWGLDNAITATIVASGWVTTYKGLQRAYAIQIDGFDACECLEHDIDDHEWKLENRKYERHEHH